MLLYQSWLSFLGLSLGVHSWFSFSGSNIILDYYYRLLFSDVRRMRYIRKYFTERRCALSDVILGYHSCWNSVAVNVLKKWVRPSVSETSFGYHYWNSGYYPSRFSLLVISRNPVSDFIHRDIFPRNRHWGPVSNFILVFTPLTLIYYSWPA